MESIKALRKYFEAEGCQFVEFKDCHIQVSKGKTTINWWPNSKRRTAHNQATNETRRHASKHDVLTMVSTGKKGALSKKEPERRLRDPLQTRSPELERAAQEMKARLGL